MIPAKTGSGPVRGMVETEHQHADVTAVGEQIPEIASTDHTARASFATLLPGEVPPDVSFRKPRKIGKTPSRPPGWFQRVCSWPRRSPSFGLSVSLTTASLVAVALLYVWSRLEVIRIGYELSQQNRVARALAEHNQRLRLELATKKDPSFVERQARERFQMQPPPPSAIRVVKIKRGEMDAAVGR